MTGAAARRDQSSYVRLLFDLASLWHTRSNRHRPRGTDDKTTQCFAPPVGTRLVLDALAYKHVTVVRPHWSGTEICSCHTVLRTN